MERCLPGNQTDLIMATADGTPARGEAAWWFDELRVPVHRYLVCNGLAPADAEEIVQETFVRLYRHLARNGSRSNLRAWIFEVARNAARDRRKSAHAQRTVALDPGAGIPDPQAGPEAHAIREERARRLQAAIAKLSAPQPISGAPSSVDSERYRISAKAEAPANLEMLRGPMLQKLLEERFQLKLHRESKEVDVFAIAIGKGGPQLPAARPGACVVSDRNHPTDAPVICGRLQRSPAGGIDALGVTLPDLCRQIEAHVEREIVDRTGLTGLYDVHLDLTPADLGIPGAAPDPTSAYVLGDGRAIAAALARIGLQMRPAKATAPFLANRSHRAPVEELTDLSYLPSR
jgi:uncharacterized protein (TIGR03435 family)